ncbi:MAG: maleate cis-trans isomerase [Bacillota bacterium]|nr:maleate cis-trans isomerase [Bacillota bacterium]
MIGWRARIGVLVPAPNTTAEWEFNKVAPEGVSIHVARCFIPDVKDPTKKVNAILKMNEDVVKAAKEVACVKPAVIGWACTTASFVKGKGGDLELARKIEDATGVKAITASTAVAAALAEIGARKIVMATPYNEEVAVLEKAFFEATVPGLEILRMKNKGIVPGLDKGYDYPSSAYRLGKELDGPDADAIFLSCTNWRTIEIIHMLEQDTGKPVISSNLSTIWACFKEIGLPPVSGYGSLLEEHL